MREIEKRKAKVLVLKNFLSADAAIITTPGSGDVAVSKKLVNEHRDIESFIEELIRETGSPVLVFHLSLSKKRIAINM